MVQENHKHLTKGDPQPPLQKGVLRLYGMRFCPFYHRVKLVLDTKKIPYDSVYIDLNDKPDWMFSKSEEAKVPTIEFEDGKVLVESLIVADYLDEAFPEPTLYPKDPREKAEDRILLEKFGAVIQNFYRLMFLKEGLNKESFETGLKALEIYENALTQRGTVYFGGAEPGMLDLMIWPWLERFPILTVLSGDSYKLPSTRLPKLEAWTKAMLTQDAVKKSYLKPEVHAKYIASRKAGNPTNDF